MSAWERSFICWHALPLGASAVRPAARRGVTLAQRWRAGDQVAEWAGHSVHVLLKVYAKCIDGQDEAARRRIEAALSMGEQG
jgi:hypothetical protein